MNQSGILQGTNTPMVDSEEELRELRDTIISQNQQIIRLNETMDKVTSKTEAINRKNHIIAESTGTGIGVAMLITGVILTPFFPPVGIPLILAGSSGTIVGTAFLARDAGKESKIRKLMKERNISYNRAIILLKSQGARNDSNNRR